MSKEEAFELLDIIKDRQVDVSAEIDNRKDYEDYCKNYKYHPRFMLKEKEWIMLKEWLEDDTE